MIPADVASYRSAGGGRLLPSLQIRRLAGLSPNSTTPTFPKLPRPRKFRGSRRNGIWAKGDVTGLSRTSRGSRNSGIWALCRIINFVQLILEVRTVEGQRYRQISDRRGQGTDVLPMSSGCWPSDISLAICQPEIKVSGGRCSARLTAQLHLWSVQYRIIQQPAKPNTCAL